MLVDYLLDKGYSIDSVDAHGNTLLHLIYEKYSDYMHNYSRLLESVWKLG